MAGKIHFQSGENLPGLIQDATEGMSSYELSRFRAILARELPRLLERASKLAENPQGDKTMSTQFDEVTERIYELQNLVSELQAENPGVGASIFGELIRACEFTLQRRYAYPQFFSDAKPRETNDAFTLRNARENLEKQRLNLKTIEHKYKTGLDNPRAPRVEYDAVEKARSRLKDAEKQLARAEGRLVEYDKDTKAERAAKLRQAGLEAAEGQRQWQERVKASK